MSFVKKPWGGELIWAHTEKYAGKILFIKTGEALSLQYHEKKDESIIVVAGKMQFEYYNKGDEDPTVVLLSPGDSFYIPAKMRHRMVGVVDAQVIEVSTPELDDVVRLEDKYGRK